MVSNTHQAEPAYSLYPYQRQVVHDAISVLYPPNRSITADGPRVVIHMPTGAGKTRVACTLASDILNRPESEGKIAVWLATTEELCDQAADDLLVAWSHLGNRTVMMNRFWGIHDSNPDDWSEGFLVAGLQKLWSVSDRNVRTMQKIAENSACVIFDEAHQAVASTYSFLAEQLATYDAPMVGLTATPGRSARGDTDDDLRLAKMFKHKKVSIDDKGHGSPITYLVSQGYLANPEFVFVDVDTIFSVPDPTAGADYERKDLTSIGEDAAWRQATVDLATKALNDHVRVLVFCPSVESAVACTRNLRDVGLRAECVLGSTPSNERTRIVEDFKGKSNEPICLFNYGVFTAGFDAPRTRCVIVARPTTSLVLYSQMIGRAMRGKQSGGNRRCQIYTLANGSLPGFGSVAEAFKNWENLWLPESS